MSGSQFGAQLDDVLPALPAGSGGLVGKEGYAAQISSSTFIVSDGTEATTVGTISYGTPEGELAEVRGPSGIPRWMRAGGNIAINALLAVDADGEFITATSGMAPVGRALQAAADQDLFKGVFWGIADESVA